MIYNGQQEINQYFHEIFNIEISGRDSNEILEEGVNAIFRLYQKYGLNITYAGIREIHENKQYLHEALLQLEGMESIYKKITIEMMESMIDEAVHGI